MYGSTCISDNASPEDSVESQHVVQDTGVQGEVGQSGCDSELNKKAKLGANNLAGQA